MHHPTSPTPLILPVMRQFTPRNRAYIKLGGRRHYLGPWGSAQADDAYRAKIRELLGVTHEGPIVAAAVRRLEVEVTHVAHLAEAFDLHAADYYTKRGERTASAVRVARVRTLLRESALDQVKIEDADASWLRDFRTWICRHKAAQGAMTRGTVNELVAVIVRMFRFGESFGLCDRTTWETLRTLEPIRKNRPPATNIKPLAEGKQRRPVPREWIRLVRRHLSRTVRLMMDVQLITGMRPEELCGIRGRDVQPTKRRGVHLYTVDADWNKMDHIEDSKPRQVWLGPRAMRLLAMTTADRSIRDGYIFRPEDAMQDRSARLTEARQTPHWPSHASEVRRGRRRASGIAPAMLGEKYTPQTYRRALRRACLRAMAAQSSREKGSVGIFTPYQLRHNAASDIANREELRLAQEMLGHKDIRTTVKYVKVWERRAATAALKYG